MDGLAHNVAICYDARGLAQGTPDTQFAMEIANWLGPWREGKDLPETPK